MNAHEKGADVTAMTDDERFDQWWNEDPRRIDQNHLKLSTRIGWHGALKQVSREREEAARIAADCDDLRARSALAERAVASLVANRHHMCAERSNLLTQIENQGRTIDTLGTHVPSAPFNPTREEAIRQRDAAREALRRLQATGQSIIDIAKNGMRE